jgi:hypothetical protein
MSGAYILTTVELRELRRLQISLVLPHGFSIATPLISAYVTRRDRDGLGVEWCDFAPRGVVELLRSSAVKPGKHPAHRSPHVPGLMHEAAVTRAARDLPDMSPPAARAVIRRT